MNIAETMEQKLRSALTPSRLRIVDDSHKHAGHPGARPEGQTHFAIEIVSTAFAGQSRLARQRLVYELLSEELSRRVHALSLTTLTPQEAEARGAG
jgi:BolA protein